MDLLIIDNSQDDRREIIQMLQSTQVAVNVTQASNALEGLNCVVKNSFDCILLDYRLPDMAGVDVMRVLNNGDLNGTAVVMMSEVANEQRFDRCIKNGAQDLLLKNEVDIRRLTHAVHQAQQQSKLEQALKDSQDKLRELTEHDPLTDLTNRYGFELCLAKAVSRAKRNKDQIAVLLLDVDDFKSVNDTLSHRDGDLLLKQIAKRLAGAKRKNDILARLGGDEFVVLATDLNDPGFAYALAKRLLDVFKAPFDLGSIEVTSSASIGISTLGEATKNVSELMKCADIAMYRSKNKGRNQIQFYSDSVHREVNRRMNLENDLRNAIKNQELEVYYQAQVRAGDGDVIGMEALLRWNHPTDGMIMPGEFLLIAEEMGLVNTIGEWVLNTACRQTAKWNKQLAVENKTLSVAVNLSASQIESSELFDTVMQSLNDSGLSANCLELEITENALIESPERTVTILEKIVAQGVTMALDDFGTGFSSLQHLKLFPIQVLKIDRGFVSDIGKGRRGERLLAALIHFARAFHVRTVAEGVEANFHSSFCSDEGCDVLQGFYYSLPEPAEAFERNILNITN
jgi:diguanylate cyclase (GGDEF)-like protein